MRGAIPGMGRLAGLLGTPGAGSLPVRHVVTPDPWSFDLQRFAGERVLPATPRRRQKAREQGQVARSAELGGAVGSLAAAAALRVTAPSSAAAFAGWAAGLWGHLPSGALDIQGVGAISAGATRVVLVAMAPVLLAAALATAAAGIAQTGFVFSTTGLSPSLARLNPAQGVARIFSRRALVELAKSLVKVGAVVAVAFGPCRDLVAQATGGALSLVPLAALTLRTAETLLLRTGVVLLVAGVGDLFYQRYELDAQLRMTPQEVREETRESEGDPAMRARRRRRARELSRRRMLADVRLADVVLTNPTHYAVALRYDPARMAAPVVVAKGVDSLAERIRALARAAGVLVVENPPLARSLYAGVKVGTAVPAALYQAVAEVLAFVWRVRGRT